MLKVVKNQVSEMPVSSTEHLVVSLENNEAWLVSYTLIFPAGHYSKDTIAQAIAKAERFEQLNLEVTSFRTEKALLWRELPVSLNNWGDDKWYRITALDTFEDTGSNERIVYLTKEQWIELGYDPNKVLDLFNLSYGNSVYMLYEAVQVNSKISEKNF